MVYVGISEAWYILDQVRYLLEHVLQDRSLFCVFGMTCSNFSKKECVITSLDDKKLYRANMDAQKN